VRAQQTRTAARAGEKTRARPSSVRGTTADRLLTLQRTAGNAAVTKAVQQERQDRAPAEPVIQRAVWTFNASTKTNNGLGQDSGLWFDDNGQSRSSKDLGVDPKKAHHGDKFDADTSHHHSSGNIKFSKKGTIPDQEYPKRETGTRKAVVEAKQKMAAAIAMLRAARDTPTGPVLAALKSGFPAFQTAQPQQIGELVPRITEVLERVQKGLNAQGAEIALVGQDASPGPDVAGWVKPSMGDLATRVKNPNQMRSEKLPSTDTGRSGPIHLTKKGEEAWTIIHEATHRFAGTLDYQYSPHSHEITEDRVHADLAPLLPPADATARESEMLGRRTARDSKTYSGQSEAAHPKKQANWYAMGRRALMNADSYAQFVLAATGGPTPRG
jgi:hypothetical protein